eukprot:CAMPEP_0171175398 /NCGR_PEP_ID=MMETSP0790-20130122/11209_1 /TAXON_ID=2925 /ORGANISM="Alexandrium catenella, Strain OF101" /LENGTH=332 /DNA_ID=CAMNT_0011640275 /DNA_START=135 /DNA_END=1133 /DNA_ORIENTATION=-
MDMLRGLCLVSCVVGICGLALERTHPEAASLVPPGAADVRALFAMAGLAPAQLSLLGMPPPLVEELIMMPPFVGKKKDIHHLKATWDSYRPCGACAQYVRVGEAHDGGYVMCGELLPHTKAAYSYGIDGFDGWGAQLSSDLGIPVEQYDCFNATRPSCPSGTACNFAFHNECISDRSQQLGNRSFGTLREQMAANGHAPASAAESGRGASLVMKMDVEGREWEVLSDSSILPLLQEFSQIIVEFHTPQKRFDWTEPALHNLLQLFAVVHVHGNNCCGTIVSPEGYAVPYTLEVTFARRGLVTSTACLSHPVESPMDADNIPEMPHLSPIRLP